jgi:hypothetical protein
MQQALHVYLSGIMLVDDWTERDHGELRRSCMGRLQMCMHERTLNFLGQIINKSYRSDSNLARLPCMQPGRDSGGGNIEGVLMKEKA